MVCRKITGLQTLVNVLEENSNHVPAGLPAGGQFAKGSGGGFSADNEYEMLFQSDHPKGVTGVSIMPKQGVSREQAVRYYKRLDAVKVAKNTNYGNGQSMAGFVDDAIGSGMTSLKPQKNGAMALSGGKEGKIFNLRHKAAIDYAKVQLNYGELAKNY